MGKIDLGTFSKISIKCDWWNFFSEIEKWLTPTIKDKNRKMTHPHN